MALTFADYPIAPGDGWVNLTGVAGYAALSGARVAIQNKAQGALLLVQFNESGTAPSGSATDGAAVNGGAEVHGLSTYIWVRAVGGNILVGPRSLDQAGTAPQVQGNVASGVADAGSPVKVGGRYNATPLALTDGQRGDLQLTPNGSIQVVLGNPSGGTTISGQSTNADTVAVSASAFALRTASMGYAFNGTTWDRMRGDAVGGLWTQGAVASGATDSGNPVKVGGKYNATLPTLADGQRGDLQQDSRGNLNVSVHGVALAPADGIANGSIISFQSYVTNSGGVAPLSSAPFTFNGSTWDRNKKPNAVARLLASAATTNAQSVKTSAGDLFSIRGQSTVATARYLKLYNKASAPTVGTDTPVATYYLAPNAPFVIELSNPLYFSAGIAYAITAGAADTDATAVAANDIVCFNLNYA